MRPASVKAERWHQLEGQAWDKNLRGETSKTLPNFDALYLSAATPNALRAQAKTRALHLVYPNISRRGILYAIYQPRKLQGRQVGIQ